LKPIVHNRTLERALELKKRYPQISVCSNLETLEIIDSDSLKTLIPQEISVIISTIPGENEMKYKPELFVGDPVIFDVAYKQKMTPLLKAVIELDMLVMFNRLKKTVASI
jgi:Shikimate 5-dehydrogenase